MSAKNFLPLNKRCKFAVRDLQTLTTLFNGEQVLHKISKIRPGTRHLVGVLISLATSQIARLCTYLFKIHFDYTGFFPSSILTVNRFTVEKQGSFCAYILLSKCGQWLTPTHPATVEQNTMSDNPVQDNGGKRR